VRRIVEEQAASRGRLVIDAVGLEATLASHLQADVCTRQPKIAEFVGSLKQLAQEQGFEIARTWACRAVSPLLDYSSLMKLGRFVLRERPVGDSTRAVRLAIVGGPTTLQLRQLVELFLAAEGIPAVIFEGGYGLFRQEILNPGSALDAFKPDLLFLAVGARDLARFPAIDASSAEADRVATAELSGWSSLWEIARSRWNATVIQNNFEIEPERVWGHFSLRHAASRASYLQRLNRGLAEQAPSFVILHDVNGLVAEAGAGSWFDPRFYYEFKMPCGADCLPVYAYSVVSLLRAARGRSKKVVAVDLDNALWGGVVGDVGAGGIQLGQGSGEGEAYVAFQTFLKELSQRGIVLAVCSKNDPDKAREPFERRPDMVLKLSDVACFAANWDNKADSLRRIADELNLKLDAFVFVDDNPAERALVRRFLPEVAVPDLPEDPAGYIQAVARYRYFETTSFTREDAARTRLYAEDSHRRELAASSADLNSFLESLKMRIKVEPIHELNIERATQLVNKSNQFNLTTRRYAVAEIRAIAADTKWRTLTFSLRDNLGDNGLVSVLLVHKRGDEISVDTWVMSCRVLQRGVEQFVRNELVDLASEERCAWICGSYLPTANNGLVSNLYADLGFTAAGPDHGQTLWRLGIAEGVPALSHFIERDSNE
jgi:FkbH-like protein